MSKTYKVTWKNIKCVRSDDQNDQDDAEETKAFVRIRAWNGAGKDILDVGKLNAPLLEVEKMNKKKGPNLPVPWTFTKGSQKHPLMLDTGEVRDMSTHSIKFVVPSGDKNARIGIRADVLEFDGGFDDTNDDFADEVKFYQLSEIGKGKDVTLICTHEDSRIHFNFKIEQVSED
jgi:hypothetical protein